LFVKLLFIFGSFCIKLLFYFGRLIIFALFKVV